MNKNIVVIIAIIIAVIAVLGFCSKNENGQRSSEKPRKIPFKNTEIAGNWNNYISIENGKYMLEDSGGNAGFDALITVNIKLKKPFPQNTETNPPSATFCLIPLSAGHSPFNGKDFLISSKEKFNEFVTGEAGTTAHITFSSYFTADDIPLFKNIAGFEGKTLKSGKVNTDSTPVMRDTATDALFNTDAPSRTGPRIIAVPELEATTKVDEDMLVGATGAIVSGLLKNKGVKSVVDYNQINKIMKQHKFEAGDWSNPAKYAEIGRALNVDTIAAGTVTRFGAIPSDTNKDGGFSGQANIALNLFSFLSPIVQAGNKNETNKNKTAAAEPRVSIYAQMTDIKSGKVLATETINCRSWNEYLEKGASLARNFAGKLPLSGMFSGSWRGIIDYDGSKYEYLCSFRAGNKCTITIKYEDRHGETKNMSASGVYNYEGERLKVNVRFNGEIPNIKYIDWNMVPVFTQDRISFSAVIPVSSTPNADRLRVVFWKE